MVVTFDVAVDVTSADAVGDAVTVNVGDAVDVAVAVAVVVPTIARLVVLDCPTDKSAITRSGKPEVNAPNIVKCVVVPVTVPAAEFTTDGTVCQLLPLKKYRPAGGVPLYASTTCTGCAKFVTGLPLASTAVRSTARPTNC